MLRGAEPAAGDAHFVLDAEEELGEGAFAGCFGGLVSLWRFAFGGDNFGGLDEGDGLGGVRTYGLRGRKCCWCCCRW